ncbi:MAG: allantoinase AllB [Opitutae bacterium]
MSSRLDLIIRGGSVVTPGGVQRVDLGVAEGRIVKMTTGLTETATAVIEAAGLHVFPGILDAHVHFNEPGRAEWEGLATGSSALAAGGGTWFGDMPLNSLPPVLDAASFAAKKALALQKSVTDFSLWGGLVPGNLDQLGELRNAGALGLKAFMCSSGVDEFTNVDASTLRAGMKRAAQLGMLVAVHAEDNDLAAQHTAAARARGTDAATWLASRPLELELAAIHLALELAGETGCALHIVHVSSPEGIALIAAGKKRGVNVTAETCPHYLLLNENEVLRQGAPAKCAPPLRPETSRRGLWRAAEQEGVDTIGSDHSPAPPGMKTAADFFAIWGGISGCQHGFPLLLSETLARDAQALPRLARQLAANVAQRFRLPHKGRLAVGFDADFSLLDLNQAHTLQNAALLYGHQQGPYAGRASTVKVVRTVRRGRTVYGEGRIASGAGDAQFLAPTS